MKYIHKGKTEAERDAEDKSKLAPDFFESILELEQAVAALQAEVAKLKKKDGE